MLIKIWNWNSNWELSVVDERGKTLEYTPVWAYDPLHIAALSVPRFTIPASPPRPRSVTESATNFFKVKADDADVDLTITVKDDSGTRGPRRCSARKPSRRMPTNSDDT